MLNQLIWYLKRPRLYPQLVRKIRSKLVPQRGEQVPSINSADWCKDRAMPMSGAILNLTGQVDQESVQVKYADIFESSGQKVFDCPVPMAGFNQQDAEASDLDIVTVSGGAGVDLLYQLSESLQAMRVIETGVAYGWSTLAILLSLKNRKGAKLISNDMPYPGKDNDDFVGCAVPEGHFSVDWKLYRTADREGIPRAVKDLGEIDLCHYDSDKSVAGRLWAYPILWHALRPGGVFVSDDVGDNNGFQKFCTDNGLDPIIVRVDQLQDCKYIGLLKKETSD